MERRKIRNGVRFHGRRRRDRRRPHRLGRVPSAIRVCRAVRDLDVYIEQPCLTYAECLAVRRSTGLPFILEPRGVSS